MMAFAFVIAALLFVISGMALACCIIDIVGNYPTDKKAWFFFIVGLVLGTLNLVIGSLA